METAVVFIIYNRPEYTKTVFESIRIAKPKKLFIIADGGKNSSDWVLVQQTRKIIQNIDWECEIQYNFSDENLGCAQRIISGLNWVFSYVDQAIILEDDCLPDFSFFRYCEELLSRYENDLEIMHISGFNILGNIESEKSYFYSKFILPPWGWATWKRAWEKFNPNLDTWQKIKTSAYKNIQQEHFSSWTDMFEHIRVNRTTWDTPWNVDLWKFNGLGIIPSKNLIKNIGIGSQATFTKNKHSELSQMKNYSISFPLNHPDTKIMPYEIEMENKIISEVNNFSKEMILSPSEISIIIPVKNNQDGINHLLDSFFETQVQTNYPKEIIIVDNNSNNEIIIKPEFQKLEIPIRLIKCQRKGPAAARNEGAKIAKGSWLLFTDSDCIFTPSSLIGYCTIKEDGVAYAGNVIPNGNDFISKYCGELNMLVPLLHPTKKNTPWYVVSANCLIKKSSFYDVNGFSEEFKSASGEDVDLGIRLADKGNIYFALESVIKHDFKNDLKDFYTRFVRYGEGHWQLEKKYGIDASPKPIKPITDNRINQFLAKILYSALKKGYFKCKD